MLHKLKSVNVEVASRRSANPVDVNVLTKMSWTRSKASDVAPVSERDSAISRVEMPPRPAYAEERTMAVGKSVGFAAYASAAFVTAVA